MVSDKIKKYPESSKKSFKVIDTIGVPHPYCITPKHLKYSDGIYLDVEGAEKKGAVCDICRERVNKGLQDKILTHDEHKQALLINCKMSVKDNKELQEYLLSIKEQAEKDNFAGFAFKKDY